MTLAELRKLISKSPNREELQKLEFTINYFDGSETIVGLHEIFRRIKEEKEAWENTEDKMIYNSLMPSKVLFYHLFNALINVVEHIDVDYSFYWTYFSQAIVNDGSYRARNKNLFSNKHSSTKFLLKLYDDEVAQGEKNTSPITDAAYKVLIQEDKSIIGQVKAYEFIMQDSFLTNRIEEEKKSLDILRSDFRTAIAEANSQVIDHLADLDSSVQKFSEGVDNLIKEKKESFEEWDKKNKSDYTGWKDKSEAEIETLRQLYAEHIKIEAPAKHWGDRADSMNKRGHIYCVLLIILIVITIGFLVIYFLNSPPKILSNVISGDADAIKWMLTTVTIVSFLTYGIRSLNKLMFSSYHLARDAEERRQLSYVYLALIKEGGADKEDRNIVLQSIFSRADTGLLKEDSSPTMPSAIYEKIMKK